MIWGFVRLTAKPQYLLMLHRGKKKSHSVTALAAAWHNTNTDQSTLLSDAESLNMTGSDRVRHREEVCSGTVCNSLKKRRNESCDP